MNKILESKGDTIEEAIKNAIEVLGCERDDVSVEVVEQPKAGFLGVGKKKAVVKVEYSTSPGSAAKTFVEGLLYRFGTPCTIKVTEDIATKTINMELSGDNMNTIIGRRGETLDAVQYLTTIVANRNEEEHWRVNIDAENYRSRREDSLETLAKKMAEKALKYKRPVALEAMPAHERRVVHSALQDVPGISTHSVGIEGSRKVVIVPEGATTTAPIQSGAKRSGGNNNRRRGGRNQKIKSPEGAPAQSAAPSPQQPKK